MIPVREPTAAARSLSFGFSSEPLSGAERLGLGAAAPYARRIVPHDLEAVLRVFPDRWPALLKAHFSSPVEVALFFRVSERAARKWWEGDTEPRARHMLRLVAERPDALPYLLQAA